MKKGLLLVFLLLLAGCGGSDNSSKKQSSVVSSSYSSIVNSTSSSDVKLDTVENVLKALKDNFTVNYTSPYGSYNIYKTKDYIYDEELGGGQFILYDDSMYVYTMHNDIVIPKTPSVGLRKDFTNFYPEFNLDLEKFTVENDVYTTTDEATLTQLGLLINSLPESKASLFMDNGFLNFRFFDNLGKVVITGRVFGINSTAVESLEQYLDAKIDPETDINENSPLIQVLGNLDNNFSYIGQKTANKTGYSILVNENYVAEFTGTKENKESYIGYVALSDGLHYFSSNSNETSVDFEISGENETLKEYAFKKHDFTKFTLIDENTYITTDYYNVNNLAELLLADSSVVNMVKVVINPAENSAHLYFMYNHETIYDGELFDINTSEIEVLDPYLNEELIPDLEHYDNTALVEATKDLTNNFTFVRTDEVLDDVAKEFYGSISTNDGRKEYKSSYSNFPSNDYIAYDDVVFSYVLDENKLSPLAYKSITREEYDATYSFESIDFTHFMPISENTWITNSKKYMRILSKNFGSNPYDEYHYQATVKLIDNKIHFEIIDTSFGVNVSGYLDKINETTLPLVEEFKANNAKPSTPNFDNIELVNIISKIRETSNFTVEYHDDPDYGLFFTEGDYDYWTKEAIYFGLYQDGFITASKSNYVYNFGWIVNEEEESKVFGVADHPSLYIDKIENFNPFKNLSDEIINSMMPYGNNRYISFDLDIVNVFVDALQLGGSSILGYAGVILEVVAGELVVYIIDQINVSYDDNGKRNEEYEIFAGATFTNVGTTIIPEFANMPTIK